MNQDMGWQDGYLDGVAHVRDLFILGLGLPLELPDLVVKHKFELFKLLVLLLEVVDALLLVSDCLIPLQQLLLVAQDVLLQASNGLQRSSTMSCRQFEQEVVMSC